MSRGVLVLLLSLVWPAAANNLSEVAFLQLQRAQTLLADGDARGANALLEERFARAEHDGERALIRQVQGFALAAIPSNRAAIERLQQALDYGELPEPAALQSRLALGQLLYVEDRLPEAIKVLTTYVAEAGDAAVVEAQVMLASAHVAAKEYRQARVPLAAAMARRQPPPLSWLELQLAIDYGLEAWAAAAETLLTLVGRAPESRQYWQQLSGVYYELGRQPQALAVLALAHRQGLLNEPRGLRNLAQLFRALGVPYKAGELLSAALEAKQLDADVPLLDSLADSWIEAREYDRAVRVLNQRLAVQETTAARLRLAQVHVQRHDWSAVVDTLGRDVQRLEGDAALLLGMAAYEQKDRALAERAFVRARGTAGQRRAAEQWLQYLAQMNG
jgi:hypothetical protein